MDVDDTAAHIEETREILYQEIRAVLQGIADKFADDGGLVETMRHSVDAAQAELGRSLRDKLQAGSSLTPAEIVPPIERHFADLTNTCQDRVVSRHGVMETFWRHLEMQGAEEVAIFMTARMAELEQSHGKALKSSENMVSHARSRTDQLERKAKLAEEELQGLEKEGETRIRNLKVENEKLQRRTLTITSLNKRLQAQATFMQRENEELTRKVSAFEIRNKKEKSRYKALSDEEEEEDVATSRDRRRTIGALAGALSGKAPGQQSALDQVIGRESDVAENEEEDGGTRLPEIHAKPKPGGVVTSLASQRLQVQPNPAAPAPSVQVVSAAAEN